MNSTGFPTVVPTNAYVISAIFIKPMYNKDYLLVGNIVTTYVSEMRFLILSVFPGIQPLVILL